MEGITEFVVAGAGAGADDISVVVVVVDEEAMQ